MPVVREDRPLAARWGNLARIRDTPAQARDSLAQARDTPAQDNLAQAQDNPVVGRQENPAMGHGGRHRPVSRVTAGQGERLVEGQGVGIAGGRETM